MRLAIGLMVACGLAAQTLEDAAGLLVSKLTAAGLGRSASLSFRNFSTLASGDAMDVTHRVQAAFSKAGIETSAGGEDVRVAVSEGVRGLLLIAQFRGEAFILPWSRAKEGPAQRRGLTLKKTFIREQSAPILDLLSLHEGADLIVLQPGRVAHYRRGKGGEWSPGHAAVLDLPRPMPRDPRGRIEGSAEEFRAFLPGTTCIGSFAPTPKTICKPDESWISGRNYFEGQRGAYFTSAGSLLAHLDRRARLWGEGAEPLTAIDAWGSDIARIESKCGAFVLVTGTGGSEDSLEAYEVVEGQVIPASEALRLPGPVTALWTAETPSEATAVVRNSSTGRYEASRVAIACAE